MVHSSHLSPTSPLPHPMLYLVFVRKLGETGEADRDRRDRVGHRRKSRTGRSGETRNRWADTVHRTDCETRSGEEKKRQTEEAGKLERDRGVGTRHRRRETEEEAQGRERDRGRMTEKERQRGTGKGKREIQSKQRGRNRGRQIGWKTGGRDRGLNRDGEDWKCGQVYLP